MANYRTRQEIFDLAWNGLKAQGFRRSMNGSTCAYRTHDGRKCAIGYLIEDGDYRHSFEGRDAYFGPVREAARIASADASFAADLQHCHDEAGGPESVEGNLRRFASTHDLTIPA